MSSIDLCGIRRMRSSIWVWALLALVAANATAATLSGDISVGSGDGHGPFRVFVVRMGLSDILAGTATRPTPGRWEVAGLPNGTYFVLGYRDENSNAIPDRGEPVGFHGGSLPTGVTISGGHSVGGVNLVLDPVSIAAELRGHVTYSGPLRGRIWVLPHVGEEFDPLNVRGTPWTSSQPGEYRSFVFVDDHYFVTAYMDVNGNLVHDPGEPIGTSSGVDVVVSPNATYFNIDIALTLSRTPVQPITWSHVKGLYKP
jgi:hypothetical protein